MQMQTEMKCNKWKIVFIVSFILTVVIFNRNRLQLSGYRPVITADRRGYSTKGNPKADKVTSSISPCLQPPCPSVYKQGKSVRYASLSNCTQPNFLHNITNPCWRTKYNRDKAIACAARVMVLGFPKCGTTDMSAKWFHKQPLFSAITGAYFRRETEDYSPQLTSLCPAEWLEHETRIQKRYLKDYRQKTTFNDCPGCAQISKVIREETTYIVRLSAIQYLQQTAIDNSRYIVTLRNPSDRLVSHFFYVYKDKRNNNPYLNCTLQQVGNSFFHKIVSESVASLTDCLRKYGTTVCVLENSLSPVHHPHPYVLTMFVMGCYSTYIREMLKFIPQERIYFSKLEEYSVDQAKAMKAIYEFVGVHSTGADEPMTSKVVNIVENQGYSSKPVLPETAHLLRTFYEPFNIELAELLNNRKWLFI